MENTTRLKISDSEISPPMKIFLNYIIPYLLLFFLPIGIGGNFLSLCIFIKRRKADRVSAQYLSVLAFFDFLAISLFGTTMWMLVYLENLSHGLLRYERQWPNTVVCKLGNYTWNVCVLMSGWIIILFSFERMLVTWSPIKMAAKLSSGKPRKIALLVLFIFSATSSSGHLIWTRLIPTIEGQEVPAKCKFDAENFSHPFWVYWFNINCFILAHGMPLVLIFTLNVLILIGIRKNRMTPESKSASSNKADNRALITLLSISFFYILFVTPFETVYFLQTYYETQGRIEVTRTPMFVQAWLTADTVQYFNYSINPFCYMGSLKFFKEEVEKIFCCGRKPRETKLESRHGKMN